MAMKKTILTKIFSTTIISRRICDPQYRKMLNRGESSVMRQLDVGKFLKRQRM